MNLRCNKCQAETERVADGRCKPCERARGSAYYAANSEKVRATKTAYRAANPEKARAAKVAYRAAHPDRNRDSKAANYAANPEKYRAAQAAYYSANSEKVRKREAASRAANPDRAKACCAAWRLANPEKARAATATWQAANPENLRINRQNRRARKCAAGGKLSRDIAAKLERLQRGKCACGCKQRLGNDYHLDHIMPLALGGSNTDDNIQLLRQRCNNQKHAKHPIDFMQQRGFLL